MAQHTYSLSLSYDSGGQFCQNILHYQFDDSSYSDTSQAALALCNAWFTANSTLHMSILPTSTSLLSLKSRGVTMPGGFEAVKLFSAVPGARTGLQQVSAVGPCVVLFPTANAKPRGRIFLPGVSDNDLLDGEFQTSFVNTFNGMRHIYSDTITLAGGATPVATPVIYSRKTVPGSSYAVEYPRLSFLPATQRRRQRPA